MQQLQGLLRLQQPAQSGLRLAANGRGGRFSETRWAVVTAARQSLRRHDRDMLVVLFTHQNSGCTGVSFCCVERLTDTTADRRQCSKDTTGSLTSALTWLSFPKTCSREAGSRSRGDAATADGQQVGNGGRRPIGSPANSRLHRWSFSVRSDDDAASAGVRSEHGSPSRQPCAAKRTPVRALAGKTLVAPRPCVDVNVHHDLLF